MTFMQAAVALPGPAGATIEVREVEVPQPGPGEVLIRVRAAGLNRGEQVGLGAFRSGAPRVMGIELSGLNAWLAGVVGCVKHNTRWRELCAIRFVGWELSTCMGGPRLKVPAPVPRARGIAGH